MTTASEILASIPTPHQIRLELAERKRETQALQTLLKIAEKRGDKRAAESTVGGAK